MKSFFCKGTKLNSIELFAGAGGLAIGTAKAGFKHVAVLDWDANSCNTLKQNKDQNVKFVRDWSIIEGDVREYDFSAIADQVDFVFGGPPCQPFSVGGKHLGHSDNRNMFPQAVRAVREIQPKAFVFENVKGLLRRNFTNYYNYILHQLRFPEIVPCGDEGWTDHLMRLEQHYTAGRYKGLHYKVIFQLLNAANFGVPQKRERVLIVGIRSDLEMEFSFPRNTHCEDALLHSKWVSGEYWDKHKVPASKRPKMPTKLKRRVNSLRSACPQLMLKPWLTVRDAISDLEPLKIGQTSTKDPNHFFNPGARSYPGHTGSPLDEPAKTLKAGDHGVPGGENTVVLGDGSVRYFSVRECARIQTFPDEWLFSGSWTESMRQLGNAVPVKLAEVVASKLMKTIKPIYKTRVSPVFPAIPR